MADRHEFIVATTLPPTTEHVIHGYNNGGQLLTYETFDVSGDSPEMRAASEFRDAQKDAFLAGEIRNPILNNCPNFQQGREHRRQLYLDTGSLMYAQQLRREAGEAETLESRLLDRMIALRVNELGFLETAALIAEGEVAPEDKAGMASVLKEASRDIYGMPDRDRALSLIAVRMDKARGHAERGEGPIAAVAEELLGMIALPEFTRYPEKVQMDEATIGHYRQLMRNEFGDAVDDAFAEVGQKDTYTVEEIKAIFDRYMKNRGYAAAGWRNEIIPNRTACATKSNEQIVEIGDRRLASRRVFDEVLKTEIHEVEHHVGRQVRGKNLGAGLAEFGLPNYSVFEEPLASTDADIYADNLTNAGAIPAMAIAVSAGYDGRERDFRDTFEVMWRLGIINTYKADKPFEEQVSRARNAAYANLVRIWRGMPTDVPGCIFPKDRMYDNTDVVEYLNNGGQPLPREDFLRLLQAKYNPLDPDQDEYIRGLTS